MLLRPVGAPGSGSLIAACRLRCLSALKLPKLLPP